VEIEAQTRATAAEYANSKTPIGLIDDRWYRWYLNPASRAIMGITDDEYQQLIGENVLVHLINPASPLYGRYPDEDRRRIFSWRVAAFQFHYADQQFDTWYLRVAQEIRRYYWAEQIWESPPDLPMFADNLVFPMIHPVEGKMLYRSQFNTILKAPRFSLSEMTPADEPTRQKMARILAHLGSSEETA
jgi:PAS domain-containing protein